MAVSTTGEVYAWGNTKNGVIGLNKDKTFVSLPHKVTVTSPCGSEIKAVDVECGYVHSVIVAVDGSLHMCGVVDTDEDDSTGEGLSDESKIRPVQVPDFNIWHRVPEPREEKTTVKWKKYGKYELKGRSAMLAEKAKRDD